MTAINVIRTMTFVTLWVALMYGMGHTCLAAKLAPVQDQPMGNEIRKTEGEAQTIHVNGGSLLPDLESEDKNVGLFDGNRTIDGVYEPQSYGMQNVVNASDHKITADQNFISIAIWTFLRVIGAAILIYGLGLTVERVFRSPK